MYTILTRGYYRSFCSDVKIRFQKCSSEHLRRTEIGVHLPKDGNRVPRPGIRSSSHPKEELHLSRSKGQPKESGELKVNDQGPAWLGMAA